jgi:hypothetical protein
MHELIARVGREQIDLARARPDRADANGLEAADHDLRLPTVAVREVVGEPVRAHVDDVELVHAG